MAQKLFESAAKVGNHTHIRWRFVGSLTPQILMSVNLQNTNSASKT